MTVLFVFLLATPVKAEEKMKLSAKVSGKLEPGQEVEISIYASKAKFLYSGDIRFKFDDSILMITSIEKGNLLNKAGIGFFEQKIMPEENPESKNIARYIFTALGNNDGYSGEGTVVVFKAKVLKKSDLSINAKAFEKSITDNYNMKIDLVSTDIKYMDYEFIPYGKAPSEVKPTPADNDAGKDEPVVQQPENPKGDTGNGSSNGETGTINPPAGNNDSKAGQGTGGTEGTDSKGQNDTPVGQNPAEKPAEETKGQDNNIEVDGKDKDKGNNSSEVSDNEKSPGSTESGADKDQDKDSDEKDKDDANPSNSYKSQQENSGKSSSGKVIGVILIIVLVGGAAAALWYFKLRHRFTK